ncbi:EmrB/QacA subfamily drug resistance transporter [Pseudoduganella flava]|uniref:DHA2 family efflux MFS transporter permease subunit n=1 Tax=Pseudoduganella flava TaxID=871742 RepID=A0A562PKM2_9BURK|nr:MDR family MFS transporter [Pseudoduganella flava]QGZ42415.1 DHA2 family efflux MFS transporter permease subunit [Pseudoduganella flava]TWI44979.1 EmrB/QacA subfamily drug resistance transporter [Pseudoduganella flava]
MNHAIHTDPAAPVTREEIRAVYFALLTMLGLGALEQSIVATALPRIVSDLGGMAHLSWVVTAFVLASTATMPLYGKLADQYGRRPMVFTALITFLVGSVLCGFAQDMTQLIVFRAIQGLGAGGFMPLAQIIIGDLVPPAERAKRQGSIAIVYAVASVLGPVLGGVVTDLLSWHWIFFINLPVGAVAFRALARSLRKPAATHAHRIDYLGSILMTGTIVALLLILALGGTEWAWDGIEVKACALLAVVLGAWLVVHVRRAAEPVLPPDLFRNRVFNIASTVMLLTFVGLMGASVFFPLFFQLVMGNSPAQSGFMTVAMMAGMILSSTVNGRLAGQAHHYKRTQVAGLALAAASFALLAWAMDAGMGYAVIEPPIFTLGLGLGLVMPNMTIVVQGALPPARRGVGTAMLTFFRSLGGLLGVTGSGAILARQLHAHGIAAVRAADPHGGFAASAVQATAVAVYRHAIASIFGAGGVIVLAALIVLLFLPAPAAE